MLIDGKELEIKPSSFGNSMALIRALAKAVKGDGIKFDMKSFKIDVSDLFPDKDGEMADLSELGDIGPILDVLISVITDEAVEKALFACAGAGMYGKSKINQELFESVDNRKNYYPIMIEIAKCNISPFLGSLDFGSLIPSRMKEIIPGSTSQQK